MSVNERQLRAESDATLAALDTIRSLEERKRNLSPESEDFLATAQQIRELSEIVRRTAERQEELAESVAEEAKVDSGPDRTISEIPPAGSLPRILAAWRTAERRLAEALPGSAEEVDLRDQVDRLRRAYAEAHQKSTGGRTGVSEG
jgi:hypothetical protein